MKVRKQAAFTLLELLVVIIILGILSTVAVINYGATIEKGRASEAKSILPQLRTARNTYMLEHPGAMPVTDFSLLDVNPTTIPDDCSACCFFSYSITATQAVATRCRNNAGKQPGFRGSGEYRITLDFETGNFSGTPGRF